MAGTINLALSQQFDMDGEPLGGGLLYFFAAGTTTPQSAFQDQLLAILHPNPIVLDASGRVPMFYLADGNIKIRLTDDSGVVVMAADNLLVIGPSSGGGGGGGVDPTTVMAPGDIKARFGTGTLDGFVRCNGRTIGNAFSSATERATADCQALFEYLWSTTVLQVFAGATPSRGATANGDWLANKQIVLPDLRGRTMAGMDDMGASAIGRLTTTGFGASGIVLGNAGGNEKLTAAQIPGHTHALLSDVKFGGSLFISPEQDTAGNAQGHTHGWGSAGTAGLNGQVDGVTGRFVTAGASVSLDHTHGLVMGQTVSSSIQFHQAAVNSIGTLQSGGVTGPNSQLDHTHKIDIGGTSSIQNSNHWHSISGATENSNPSVTVQPTVQPTMVLTFYIKL